ncbi:hypothetical protein ACN6K3_002977 [Streptomyces sp. SAS_260]
MRQRIAAVLVVTAAAIGGLAPLATAAPMPWETSRQPAGTHAVVGHHENTVTPQCGTPCYQ